MLFKGEKEQDLDIAESYNQVLFFCIFQRKALCAILYPVQKLGINKNIPWLFRKYSKEHLKSKSKTKGKVRRNIYANISYRLSQSGRIKRT